MRQHLPPLAGSAQHLTRSVCQQERHALRPFIGLLPVAGPSSPANLPRRRRAPSFSTPFSTPLREERGKITEL